MSSSTLLKNRFLSFTIWQTIQSFTIFTLFKTLILSPFYPLPFLSTTLSLLLFLTSSLLFSLSLHLSSSPLLRRPASFPHLTLAALRFVVTSSSPSSSSPEFLSRASLSLSLLFLVFSSAVCGFLSLVSLPPFSKFGLRGLVSGLLYGLFCVYSHRYVLTFPIVQRPPFFSYKIGIPLALRQASKLSTATFFLSTMATFLLPYQENHQVAGGYISENIVFYVATFAAILSWELTFHLHKVLHTKRFVFASSSGSPDVGGNSSEPLLLALEDISPGSLLRYLAYLDLCMVCGGNVDPWRRASFFEETGETYKRVVAACLRPLQLLTSKLAEGLGSADNAYKLSHQLCSPDDMRQSSEILELLNDFQLHAWCAQAVSSLEVHSRKEDRFGVAQLTGSHAVVVSTLLSCLLAVETFMGKKVNLQSPNQVLGPAGIKWATNSTARTEITTAMNKRRGSLSHLKSYALADVLKTSVYAIVSEFQEEMLASAKSGSLEKDWVSNGKVLYGSVELLIQKLHFFLSFQAS